MLVRAVLNTLQMIHVIVNAQSWSPNTGGKALSITHFDRRPWRNQVGTDQWNSCWLVSTVLEGALKAGRRVTFTRQRTLWDTISSRWAFPDWTFSECLDYRHLEIKLMAPNVISILGITPLILMSVPPSNSPKGFTWKPSLWYRAPQGIVRCHSAPACLSFPQKTQ